MVSLRKRQIEDASVLKRDTIAAWYLSICLVVVMLGAIWIANASGLIDLTGSSGGPSYKQAAAAAAKKAAERDAQARLAAQIEARNIAEDAKRANGPQPVASASAAPEAETTAAKDDKAAAAQPDDTARGK
jgi:hypothetical protein